MFSALNDYDVSFFASIRSVRHCYFSLLLKLNLYLANKSFSYKYVALDISFYLLGICCSLPLLEGHIDYLKYIICIHKYMYAYTFSFECQQGFEYWQYYYVMPKISKFSIMKNIILQTRGASIFINNNAFCFCFFIFIPNINPTLTKLLSLLLP